VLLLAMDRNLRSLRETSEVLFRLVVFFEEM